MEPYHNQWLTHGSIWVWRYPLDHWLKLKLSDPDVLQWVAAPCIIAGHSLNAIGPSVYPWNVIAFFIGTFLFLVWTVRVNNKPQFIVNSVSLSLGCLGLYNAFLL